MMVEQPEHAMEKPESMMAKMRHKLQTPVARIMLYMIGGTFVWSLYLMIVYPLASLTCQWGWFGASAAGSGLKIIQTITTLLALALVAAFAFAAFNEWRRTRTDTNGETGQTKAAVIPLLAFVTLLLNGLYLLIIVVSLLPIAMLPVCA
ncbi:MAG: hypothetical protein IT328_11875 [Caldilineaceae bacterium]|nr:hypothetical protein [Caldilineaceae bacterium]